MHSQWLKQYLDLFVDCTQTDIARTSNRSMAEDRAAKLRKIQERKHSLPHMSTSAFAAVYKDVLENGVPDAFSRQHLMEASKIVRDTMTPHGPLHQTIEVVMNNGKQSHLPICSPLAMLWHCFQACDGFRLLLEQKHQQIPSSFDKPWNLILYSDEVTPGDVTSQALSRKVQAIYYSFKELGHASLCREDAWFCVLVARSKTVQQMVPGGLVQIMKAVLMAMFAPDGTNLQLTGIHLSNSVRLFAKLAIVVQDGAAHKELWGCRDGTRICMKCLTVAASSELTRINPNLKSNVTKVRDLDKCTDADVKHTARRLACFATHVGESKSAFTTRQQLMGYTFMPHSLLTDMSLDAIIHPVSQFMHDWMHGLFSKGVFQISLHLLLESLEEAEVHSLYGGATGLYEILFESLKPWKFPKMLHCSNLHALFEPKRRLGNKKASTFHSSASESLNLYAPLVFWVSAIVLPTGMCTAACKAFIAFGDIAECAQVIACGKTSPATLQTAIENFLDLFVQAWGFDSFTPKIHWLLHYSDELAQHETLYSCFTHERKHKLLKKIANPILNTRAKRGMDGFEHSVLTEITSHHLMVLKDFENLLAKPGLIKPYKAKEPTLSILAHHVGDGVQTVASQARFNEFESCSVGDVVLTKVPSHAAFVAAEVWLHFDMNGKAMSILSCWDLQAMHSEHNAAEWLKADNPQVLATTNILTTVVWMDVGGNVIRTLVPSWLL